MLTLLKEMVDNVWIPNEPISTDVPLEQSAGALISQLPPAVVARLIGVDIETASAWYAIADSSTEHR